MTILTIHLSKGDVVIHDRFDTLTLAYGYLLGNGQHNRDKDDHFYGAEIERIDLVAPRIQEARAA